MTSIKTLGAEHPYLLTAGAIAVGGVAALGGQAAYRAGMKKVRERRLARTKAQDIEAPSGDFGPPFASPFGFPV